MMFLSTRASFDAGAPLQVRDVTSSDATEPVASEALKIVFVMSGWAEVFTAEQTVSLAQGAVLTIPPRLECYGVPAGWTRTITLYAQPDFAGDHIRWVRARHPLVHHVRRALQEDSGLQRLQLPTSTMTALTPQLVRLAQLPASAEHQYAMFSIVVDLFAATAPFSAEGHRAPVRPRDEVLKAINLLQKSPERRWRAEELAQAVSLSRAQLNRLFRDQIGIPPAAYLSRLRANRMAELLSTKRVTVAEAAARAGWERPEIATRTFKKQFGMSPRDYATIARAQRPGTEDLAERVSRPTHTRSSARHPQ